MNIEHRISNVEGRDGHQRSSLHYSTFNIRYSLFALLCVSVPLWFTGCSDTQLAEVSGKVVYEGRPVTSGYVIVYSKSDWKPKGGAIQADGSYTVNNVPAGLAFVALESSRPKEESKDWFPIPQKYAVAAHSNLKCELQPGGNTFDIVLTGDLTK